MCDAIDPDSVRVVPKLKLGKAKIKSVKNKKSGTVKVTMKMMEGPSGFYFSYGRSKNFSDAKTFYTKNIHVVLKNLRKGKRYYFRARAALKEDGLVAKGKWSAQKSIKVK